MDDQLFIVQFEDQVDFSLAALLVTVLKGVHDALVHGQTDQIDRGGWGSAPVSGRVTSIVVDPADPDAAWVVPEEGAENRVTPDARLGVYRTRDAGASWQLLENGLPSPAWAAVLREGMTYDDRSIAVGTQSGSIFVTSDGGESWIEAASQLPPVLSVELA